MSLVSRVAAFNFSILPATDYGDLHDFYQKVAAADQQQLILTPSTSCQRELSEITGVAPSFVCSLPLLSCFSPLPLLRVGRHLQ